MKAEKVAQTSSLHPESRLEACATGRQLHLVCNSHLDPVWLWDWEEGIAAAIATFRTAAEICEQNPAFVFNQNEALLYEWVEQHEPALFRRIRRLVKKGRWHIMGGWFLQPDCTMPAGESIVRQVEYGRRYFLDKFGKRPTTAINFDSFGHSRGLVQILARSGFDSYVFCRPAPGDRDTELVANEFRWVGFDGSEIVARRAQSHYLSLLGQAVAKIEKHLKDWPGVDIELILWGVGNHGGGPSRLDVEAIAAYGQAQAQLGLRHSNPEAYFRAAHTPGRRLPVWRRDINPWGVGCYSSQIRIKQDFRRLENELYLTEKLCAYASLAGAADYPHRELASAERDLLLAQFHDILPGSGAPTVERSALRLMAHAAEQLARIRRGPLFAFAAKSTPARPGEVPLFVFNPHPHPLRTLVECELQMADQNWESGWHTVEVVDSAGRTVPAQVEKEESNLNLDWRKKVVFLADLPPAQVARFDCRFVSKPSRYSGARRLGPRERPVLSGGYRIDVTGGDVREIRDGRRRVALRRGFQACVFADSGDPWSVDTTRFDRREGDFQLLTRGEAARFAAVSARSLDPVRVVEDGLVRTVVESLWGFGASRLCLSLTFPKDGTWIEAHVRLHWREHSRALKLGFTLPEDVRTFTGQTMFGHETLPLDGREGVAQRWVLARDSKTSIGLLSDGGYGCSVTGGTVWLTLLRSPYYSALPLPDRALVAADRYLPVVDQGLREFRVRLLLEDRGRMPALLEQAAQAWNEAPLAYGYFPGPVDKSRPRPEPGLTAFCVSNPRILLTSARIDPSGGNLRLRLCCSADSRQTTTLDLPAAGVRRRLAFGPFEVKTLEVDLKRRALREVPMA